MRRIIVALLTTLFLAACAPTSTHAPRATNMSLDEFSYRAGASAMCLSLRRNGKPRYGEADCLKLVSDALKTNTYDEYLKRRGEHAPVDSYYEAAQKFCESKVGGEDLCKGYVDEMKIHKTYDDFEKELFRQFGTPIPLTPTPQS